MLKNTDIRELAKRMKIGECSIRRVAGIYVNTDKDKVCSIQENFQALPESLYFKYLNIAKDVLGKKIGDNMLSIRFEEDDMKVLLGSAIASDMKGREALDAIYDRIIDYLPEVGNYLILLFNDVYDIPRVGSDGVDQDESEEVYEYIMGAVCRVNLTAAGLSYIEEKNTFDVRERDWVVERPSCGFVYPAFEERTVERDKVLFYAASPSDPPHELMESGLGLMEAETITEINARFERLICIAAGGTEEGQRMLPRICEAIYLRMDEKDTVTSADMGDCCLAAGTEEILAEKIAREYRDEFSDRYPRAAYLINKSMLKKIEELQKKREWKEKCAKAAKEIEKLGGEKQLISDLKELAARK